MPTKIIGNAPYQVPRNSDLGSLSYQDKDNVNITGGAVSTNASVTAGYFQNTDISEVKPSLMLDFANGKTLDSRITFTRSTTATYYDGKTNVVAEQNLCTYSETLVGNQSSYVSLVRDSTKAPDGNITADLLVPTSDSGRHYLNSFRTNIADPVGTTVTASVYAKAGGYNYACIQLSFGESGGGCRYTNTVDLTNGTVTGFTNNSNVSNYSTAVTNVGNGWYRIALTATSTAANVGSTCMYIHAMPASTASTAADNLPSYAGDNVSGVYFWGGQIEYRSAAGTYVPTTFAPITNYIPQLITAAAGVARFDHDPITGESKGLLIEEARTNNLTYSQDFSNGAWSKSYGASIFTNAAIAPDGTLSAVKAYPSATDNYHFIAGAPSTSMNGVLNTLSLYAKAGEYKFVSLAERSLISAQATFDLVNGTVVSQSSTVTSSSIYPVGNGWYRCSVTLTTRGDICIHPLPYAPIGNPTNAPNYVGDGFSGVYVWGPQLENAAFTTSYIPTTSSAVTRSADSATMSGNNFTSWFRQDEGTMYASFKAASFSAPSFPQVWTMSDGSTNYAHNIDVSGNGVRAFTTFANTQASDSIFSIGSISSQTYNVAYSYKRNDYGFNANGGNTQYGSAALPAMPVVNMSGIGNFNGYQYFINGTIKKLAFYPKRLTNAELAEITL